MILFSIILYYSVNEKPGNQHGFLVCKFFIKSLLRDCIFHLHVLQGPRQPEIAIFCFILGGAISVAPFSGLPDGNKGLVKGNIYVSKYEPAIP